jgi:hypothetical protein
MAQLSDFYIYLRPYAPATPIPALDLAIREAAIEFCRESRTLRYAAEPIVTTPGQSDYDIDVDAEGDVFEVVRAIKVGGSDRGEKLQPMRETEVDPEKAGRVRGYWIPDRNMIAFWPIPDRAETVRLTCAVCPKAGTTTLDDRLLRDWKNGVIAGAVIRLGMAGQISEAAAQTPWQQIYESEVTRAAELAQQSFTRAPLRSALWV